MNYLIGVDAGGTSTKTAAYDEQGRLLYECSDSFGNPLIDEKKAFFHIRRSIERVMMDLKGYTCQAIILGVAGIDTGNYADKLREELKALPTKNLTIMNDAWLAHTALLEGEDGYLTIAGTGSICIGKWSGKTARVGGWGHLLGDEGSGYAIVLNSIKRVLKHTDEEIPYSPIQQKLLDSGPFSSVFELVKFVYSSDKGEVAKCAEMILESANQGDKEAQEELTKAGVQLADQTLLCTRKLQMSEEVSIAVSGSILMKNDWVYQAFEQRIKEVFPQSKRIRRECFNTIGAYFHYKKRLLGEG